jgi:hypothetical protein
MQKRIVHVLPWLLVFVAGIMFGPTLIHSAAVLFEPTAAIASSPAQDSPEDSAAQASLDCKIEMVAASATFVGVRCYNAVDTVVWYAYPTTNAQQAARLLSTALTAHAADKELLIYYETATTGLPAGCSAATCRGMTAVYMMD